MIGKLPMHPTQRFERRELDDIVHVVIHHSAGRQRPVNVRRYIKAIARYHVQNRGWPGIAYTHIVDADGRIWLTGDLGDVRYHAGDMDWNDHSVGVCLLGDFRHGHVSPTVKQIASTLWLIDKLGKPIKPHKRIVATACPGDLRAKWWKELKQSIRKGG